MTCIVSVVDKGIIYMGADSASVGGLSLRIRKDEKVFIKDGFIFGFTSSWRMGQLLQYSLNIPTVHDKDLFTYMVTDFINAVRQCLKDNGFSKKINEEESGGTFMVGHRGRLFKIYDDYQVEEVFEAYNACGCGEDMALGSLYSTKGDKTPRARLLKALAAAAHFSAGVSEPFVIKALGKVRR